MINEQELRSALDRLVSSVAKKLEPMLKQGWPYQPTGGVVPREHLPPSPYPLLTGERLIRNSQRAPQPQLTITVSFDSELTYDHNPKVR